MMQRQAPKNGFHAVDRVAYNQMEDVVEGDKGPRIPVPASVSAGTPPLSAVPTEAGGMTKIQDDITLEELVRRAAHALTRAGMQHRIDIYRDVEVDDPAVRMMLGRSHRVRVRVKITAASLLFEASDTPPETSLNGASHGDVHPSSVETRIGVRASA
jgi:hypothetical protein